MTTVIFLTTHTDDEKIADLLESLEAVMPSQIIHRPAIAVQFSDQPTDEAVTKMLVIAGIPFSREALESPAPSTPQIETLPTISPPLSDVSDAGKCKFCESPLTSKRAAICGKSECKKKQQAEYKRIYREAKAEKTAPAPAEPEEKPANVPFDESPMPWP